MKISDIISSQIIIDSLFKGFMIVLPYFIPFLIGAVVVCIIKKIIVRGVFNFSLISGESRCSAKKKAKTAGDIVDFASSINDIMGMKK